MTTRLITPPAALALSLEDGRLAARRTGTELDAEIAIAIKGLVKHVEQVTQRSIIHRTYQQVLDKFPDAIKLYYPPIASVSWVKYYDEDGVLQTLDPADYELDSVREGYLVPAPDAAWPSTQCGKINAVMVEYVAGYGADHTSTPDEFKLYLKAKVAEHFGIDKASEFIEGLIRNSGEKIWSLG